MEPYCCQKEQWNHTHENGRSCWHFRGSFLNTHTGKDLIKADYYNMVAESVNTGKKSWKGIFQQLKRCLTLKSACRLGDCSGLTQGKWSFRRNPMAVWQWWSPGPSSIRLMDGGQCLSIRTIMILVGGESLWWGINSRKAIFPTHLSDLHWANTLSKQYH